MHHKATLLSSLLWHYCLHPPVI